MIVDIDKAGGKPLHKLRTLWEEKLIDFHHRLLTENGVLFENFVTNGQEQLFTNQVVLPAFKKIRSIFGLQPLIVPIIPSDQLDDEYWLQYQDCT